MSRSKSVHGRKQNKEFILYVPFVGICIAAFLQSENSVCVTVTWEDNHHNSFLFLSLKSYC